MKKSNILKKNEDYTRIINAIKPYKSADTILYVEKTNSNNYYFGFSIGKKLGNAVLRNKIKRQVKSILDKKEFINGFNCIIMVKRSFVEKSFKEKEKIISELLNKVGVIKFEK